jgi:ATP-binding cassette subfamily B protein
MTERTRPRGLVPWRHLAGELRPYRLHIAAILVVDLVGAPLSLLNPLPVKIAVDAVTGTAPLPAWLAALTPDWVAGSVSGKLLLAGAIVITVALAGYLCAFASWVLQAYTGEKLTLDFRAKLFARVQRLSLDYHDRKGTMDSVYRIERDAPSLQSLAVNGIVPFVAGGVSLLAMIYVTARIDIWLAAIALAIVPALYGLAATRRRRLRLRWAEYKQLESGTISLVQEVLGALRVVKAFGREDRERDQFVARSGALVSGQVKVALIEGGFDLLVGLVLALGTASVLIIGARHVLSGELSLGDLLMVMGYLAQLYRPLETISRKAAELQGALAGAERAFAVLELPPDVGERPDARPLKQAKGIVTFEHVSFSHETGSHETGSHETGSHETGECILDDFDFEIPAGGRVGIVGATGAGKTTLISLLTRFYDPTRGRILLDGIDLREYRLADLRRQFALVLQEPVLFSTTIAENIAYGRAEAAPDEIVRAARAANAHDFIVCLPKGYETQVGERGLRLSGGERQRVSLARAFLKDAPILLLDEPTSAIDVATEAAIVGSLECLMRGRTSLMVAHRLTTLRNCDLILEIERGRIRRFGPRRDEFASVGASG